jgi:type IV pilus assembly protein PilA
MKYRQTQSQAKWQGNLLLQQGDKGFTLIELLVVTIIVGILAAISIPNFINQIGKARETEAKNQLGTMARAQEAYHFEKGQFADSLDKLALTGSFTSKYYDYLAPVTTTDFASQVKHEATAKFPLQDRVRDYAAGVYFGGGLYSIIICQSDAIPGAVDAPDTPADSCSGGIQIE